MTCYLRHIQTSTLETHAHHFSVFLLSVGHETERFGQAMTAKIGEAFLFPITVVRWATYCRRALKVPWLNQPLIKSQI